MSDVHTVTITDERIADLTPNIAYGVYNGAQQSTYQAFPFNSASNSSLTCNIQIPSESICSDARVLLQSDLNLTINIANVPNSMSAFQYGISDALNSYPLQSLMTTSSLTVNNATSSTNYKDVLPFVKLLEDKKNLDKMNSTSPDMVNETWGNYADAILSNSNPMGNMNDMAYDNARVPNGSYPATIVVNRYVSGIFADNSLISTGSNNTWIIYLTFKALTEPFLALSPFISNDFNRAGLIGLNNIAMTLNVDSACSKVWTTGNGVVVNSGGNGWTSYITSIQLGNPSSNNLGFTNSKLLFNFLTLSDLQYSQVSTKSVTNYTSYDRYISPSSNAPQMTANTGGYSVTFQNIQLSQVPSLMVFALRVPITDQNWAYTDGFLSVAGVSITFNNQSGLLASANVSNLYNISKSNGSNQSFYSFRGTANAVQTNAMTVPTLGSMIVINPAKDLSLNGLLSNGSIGQFNVQITLTGVTNQYPFAVRPEGILMVLNEGFMVTQLGNSQLMTAVLSRESVLDAKSDHSVNVVDEQMYSRTVGGRMRPSQVHKFMKHHHRQHKDHPEPEHKPKGGKHMGKSKLQMLLR
jgi:hypothetical protein